MKVSSNDDDAKSWRLEAYDYNIQNLNQPFLTHKLEGSVFILVSDAFQKLGELICYRIDALMYGNDQCFECRIVRVYLYFYTRGGKMIQLHSNNAVRSIIS